MFGRSAIPGGMGSYGKDRSRRAVESLPRSLVFTSNSRFLSRPSRQRVVKIGVIGNADQAVERGTGGHRKLISPRRSCRSVSWVVLRPIRSRGSTPVSVWLISCRHHPNEQSHESQYRRHHKAPDAYMRIQNSRRAQPAANIARLIDIASNRAPGRSVFSDLGA